MELEMLIAVAGAIVAAVGYSLWTSKRRLSASLQYLAEISERQNRRGLV